MGFVKDVFANFRCLDIRARAAASEWCTDIWRRKGFVCLEDVPGRSIRPEHTPQTKINAPTIILHLPRTVSRHLNFAASLFSLLGVGFVLLAFGSFFISGLAGFASPWLPFLVFLGIGIFLLAVARAFAKRG